ncbi:MAG: acetolactate synthase small subunit [Thaumarchaeota archaeon]|jgi:acetolactate synthase-1/3 small subunit|nr:acetolactate synthase small subunit [Marine Group I thaumarchaeote]PXF27270.1 MAG: acetolactate synthase small subunit [Nitrososphaerota archaeon]HIA09804.1 acetolactate synthase small subunit [Candidatus Nitrosopelagicus sp.]HIO85552.1 acetolactate synthase small subunit [Candidatus Nitrosopelagicus sp.]|tara:strand:+ start:159 stop:635 length:477 start_codon:yes stop_codon:yes gene_type:complete
MWAILSIRVENRPGILFKVSNLFRARNFNIDSLTVGVMEDPSFAKMTITTVGDEKQIAQIVKQLDKMIDTIEVKILDEKKSVYKELVLFKIKLSKTSDSTEINKLANTYGAKIHDEQNDLIIIELTSTPDQISAFEELIKPFGILDSARTGVTALQGS